MDERLQQAFQNGDLLKPDAKALSLVDAVNAIAHLAGITPPNPTDQAAELADQIGPSEHFLVVVVPGLCDQAVLDLPDDALLKKHRRRKLRHVVPGGQATMIATLATGLWPVQHGVFGRTAYLSERQRFVDVLSFTDKATGEDLKAAGIVPTRVFREMPLWVDAQAEPVAYVSETSRNSVWANYLSGYRTLRRCEGLLDAVTQHCTKVDESDGPTIGIVVLDELVEPSTLNDQLAEVRKHRGDRSLKVIVIGGGASIQTQTLEDVSGHAVEAGLLPEAAGEPRFVMMFDGQEGVEQAAVAQVFGEGFAVLPAQELVDAGWFGPAVLTPFAEKRLPDWVAIAVDGVSVGEDVLVSGGLMPNEVLLPMVIV